MLITTVTLPDTPLKNPIGAMLKNVKRAVSGFSQIPEVIHEMTMIIERCPLCGFTGQRWDHTKQKEHWCTSCGGMYNTP